MGTEATLSLEEHCPRQRCHSVGKQALQKGPRLSGWVPAGQRALILSSSRVPSGTARQVWQVQAAWPGGQEDEVRTVVDGSPRMAGQAGSSFGELLLLSVGLGAPGGGPPPRRRPSSAPMEAAGPGASPAGCVVSAGGQRAPRPSGWCVLCACAGLQLPGGVLEGSAPSRSGAAPGVYEVISYWF